MGLFRRFKQPKAEREVTSSSMSAEERERLPQTLRANCLGEACAHFSGVECSAYLDLLRADGKSGGKDLPPYQDEATYAIYGNICMGGPSEVTVGITTKVLKPDEANGLKIIGITGAYGDLPQTIESGGRTLQIETAFSSQG